MNFEFSEEQEQLRATLRRFLEDRAPVTPYVRRCCEGLPAAADHVWQGLVEIGATGLLVPEAQGGSGLGFLEMGVVLEEMGRMVHPGPFLASAVGATSLVRCVGSRDDQQRWLPGLAAGSCIATPAFYEPGARYAWRRPSTRALAEDEEWRLEGEKCHVLGADAADVFLVLARAGGELGVFAVERASDGVKVASIPGLDGTRRHGTLRLDGARAMRLGVGDATRAVVESLDRIGVGMAADGVGAAARALELAVEYAREREQFGRPIGSFQAVAHLLAEMLRDLELGRAGVYYALWAADSADPDERHRAACMARAWASSTFPRIAEGAIQVFGGVGFTWEMDLHFYYKRLLTLAHSFGDSSEHLSALAEILLD